MTSAVAPQLAEDIKRAYTLDEFYAWLRHHPQDDVQYELVNGRIMEKDKSDAAGPSGRHGEIMNRLGYFLTAHALPNNLGRIFSDAPF